MAALRLSREILALETGEAIGSFGLIGSGGVWLGRLGLRAVCLPAIMKADFLILVRLIDFRRISEN